MKVQEKLNLARDSQLPGAIGIVSPDTIGVCYEAEGREECKEMGKVKNSVKV